MKTYLVTIEGTAPEVSAAGHPVWRFTATRSVKANSEAEARTVAVALVARDWASGKQRGYGAQPYLKVTGLRGAHPLEAWWRGRGGYVFHPLPAAKP